MYLEHGATGASIPYSRPEVIRKSVEGSLKQLQADYTDIYYQHRVLKSADKVADNKTEDLLKTISYSEKDTKKQVN